MQSGLIYIISEICHLLVQDFFKTLVIRMCRTSGWNVECAREKERKTTWQFSSLNNFICGRLSG